MATGRQNPGKAESLFPDWKSAALFLVACLLPSPAGSQPPAVCSRGGEPELACWFDQGLRLQERSDLAEAPEEKKSLLEEAAAAYERALVIDPTRGAVLNNLAGVSADLGRNAKAENLFQTAVEQEEESRQPFYRRNFGDFLARHGKWARAAEQYQKSLEEEPEDFHAHEGLTAILSGHFPEELPKYLRSLISRGQVLWAEEIALTRIQKKPTEQYLSLLVESLAKQFPAPDELLSESVVQVLQDLTQRPEVAEGAREILLLSQGERLDPASYRWWAERGQRQEVDGPSPRQAFQGLIRTFGEAHRRADRPIKARAYLELAVTLTSDEPDLQAFRWLLDLPPTVVGTETIDRLAASTEKSLQRRDAGSPAQRYLYHHDLGLFYASEQRWSDDRGQSLGIDQLQKAVELANTPVVGPPGGDPPFDARIYFRLMERYVDTDRQAEARRIWKDLAAAYAERGMEAEADILLLAFPVQQDRPDTESTQVVLDDPSVPLTGDFTTEPPEPPR